MGPNHFLTKGLKSVSAEMSLQVLAYNLKRTIGIIGVAPLVAAIMLLIGVAKSGGAVFLPFALFGSAALLTPIYLRLSESIDTRARSHGRPACSRSTRRRANSM